MSRGGSITDQELIDRVLDGQQDEYADLVRRHYPKVLGLCASLLADRDLAEDAAQEAFLKAYESLSEYRATASFSTWLYRIASNHCLDMIRRRKRRREESWDALCEQEAAGLQALLTEPRERTGTAEDADMIDRVLSCLPADYRLILTLREVQGLSYKEIMEVMECSLDSIKARLRRARRTLQEKARHFLGSKCV